MIIKISRYDLLISTERSIVLQAFLTQQLKDLNQIQMFVLIHVENISYARYTSRFSTLRTDNRITHCLNVEEDTGETLQYFDICLSSVHLKTNLIVPKLSRKYNSARCLTFIKFSTWSRDFSLPSSQSYFSSIQVLY